MEIPTSISASKPDTTKPFHVEQLDFRYGEPLNFEMVDLAEDKISSWPMVYILSNDEYAYVGQTTSVKNRMDQHGANIEKKDFTLSSIIFHEEFNASVATDYEHRLIGLLHADGRYKLTNKNEGMSSTNYFAKADYAAMFEDLWEELRHIELAGQSIADIEESEIFKFSPYKGLTPDQHVALDSIMLSIRQGLEKAEPIVVEGMPGTGKTVLAIFLLKMLKDTPEFKDLNIKLLEPITSLKTTLRNSLKCVSGLSPDDIIGPVDLVKESYGFKQGKKKNFDIILVDEAHKLKRRKNLTRYPAYDNTCKKLGMDKSATQLDWVLDQAKLPVFFYDPLQSIGPNCIERASFEEALGDAAADPIRLDSQMRVKGGAEYLNYIHAILEGKDPDPQQFEGYELVLHRSFVEFIESFETKLARHDMTRMAAGYAWYWETKKNPEAFDIEIDGIRLRWNCTNDDWVGKGVNDPKIAHEVGCIHSTQGYDLSYAYIVIGRDIAFEKETGCFVSDKSNYYDRNGWASASTEELDRFIRNIYYVLLTRGIYGTHIYVQDEELRAQLSKYFSVR